MAVLIDVVCSHCGKVIVDVWSTVLDSKHESCPGRWERYWTITDRVSPMCHESERCVIYVSAQEGGKIQYPGRGDVPVPARLRKRGYERVEMGPRELRSFEKKHSLINEKMHYHRNGRGV